MKRRNSTSSHKKTKRNLATFSRIQYSPARAKYMMKHIKTQLETYLNAYKETKNEDSKLAGPDIS